MVENKQGFVDDLKEALIRNGAGRYDHLRDDAPHLEERTSGIEILHYKRRSWNVTGDSLASIGQLILDAVG